MSAATTRGAAAAAPTVLDRLYDLDGQRVRVTWPNGHRRSGNVTTRKVGVHDCAFLDGLLVGGEFSNAVKIELMAYNGRYQDHWELVRTLAKAPEHVLRLFLQRHSGPALETAREEARLRGWSA